MTNAAERTATPTHINLSTQRLLIKRAGNEAEPKSTKQSQNLQARNLMYIADKISNPHKFNSGSTATSLGTVV